MTESNSLLHHLPFFAQSTDERLSARDKLPTFGQTLFSDRFSVFNEFILLDNSIRSIRWISIQEKLEEKNFSKRFVCFECVRTRRATCSRSPVDGLVVENLPLNYETKFSKVTRVSFRSEGFLNRWRIGNQLVLTWVDSESTDVPPCCSPISIETDWFLHKKNLEDGQIFQEDWCFLGG